MTPRILTIMGSGEMTPTMVSTHRLLTSKLSKSERAVLLDTPYGFQENAAELTAKALEYFKKSVNITLESAGLTKIIFADPLTVERGLQKICDANYIFAGPGSPTYALRQWSDTSLAGLLNKKLSEGGMITFASAAALTLGHSTLPIYEIYKAGQDPYLLKGLNILGEIGVHAILIPHYNNTDGGHHDTRFCYMGEQRLRLLERQMPDEVYVLGIDEHSAFIIDLDSETVTVTGKGCLTVRLRESSIEIPSGQVFSLKRLRHPELTLADTTKKMNAVESPVIIDAAPVDGSLRAAADRLNSLFAEMIVRGDGDGAGRAALELETALADWSADVLQSDATTHAREIMRSMISRLAAAATGGLLDNRRVIGPFVQALLDLRSHARAANLFELSDKIRGLLSALNIEVRDMKTGTEWDLK